MYLNTNYFALWWISVLKQMGLELVSFLFSATGLSEFPFNKLSPPHIVGCVWHIENKSITIQVVHSHAWLCTWADTHIRCHHCPPLMLIHHQTFCWFKNTSARQVTWKTRDVRGAWFDPRMEVSYYEPPVHPTVNRSKHICFCVQL